MRDRKSLTTIRSRKRSSRREVSLGVPDVLRVDPGRAGTDHHHSGLGLLTPADVHHGLAEQRVAARTTVLTEAYTVHPAAS
jgi:hypothetical protein